MNKIKFAVIGAVESENTKDLKLEIERLGHSCTLFKMTDLIFSSDGKGMFNIYYDGNDVLDYDIFFFRGYNKEIKEAKIFAEYLLFNKKVVVENLVGSGFLAGKMFEGSRISRKQIPWLRTCQALSKKNWKEILSKAEFPIIIKPVNGTRGRDVFKVENFDQAWKIVSERPKEFLMQEYVKTDGDVRVFVIGENAIGAMKRFILPGDVRSNISLGAKAIALELTDEMSKISIAAAKAMGIDIAGVDLIFHGNKWRILEVNEAPQWQGFKQATKINPAKYIVEYALKKYSGQ